MNETITYKEHLFDGQAYRSVLRDGVPSRLEIKRESGWDKMSYEELTVFIQQTIQSTLGHPLIGLKLR